MPFLVIEDYADQIKTTQLTTITEGDDNNRLKAEAKAIDQAFGMLSVRYDAAAIFAKQGAARSASLVMYLVDMSLYHLHTRITPGQVPTTRAERYADALKWMGEVSSGSWNPGFPKVGDANNDGVDDKEVIQWGGMAKRNPYY